MTPDPEMLVTDAEAQRLLGLSSGRINTWRYTKKIKALAQRPGNQHRPFSLYRLGDLILLQDTHRHLHELSCPDGYVRAAEVAKAWGVTIEYVRHLAREKLIRAIPIRLSPQRLTWCIHAEAALEWQRNRKDSGRRGYGSIPILAMPVAGNPLLSADNQVCLQARREKFVAAGRIFRWNWRKVLDGRKRAG